MGHNRAFVIICHPPFHHAATTTALVLLDTLILTSQAQEQGMSFIRYLPASRNNFGLHRLLFLVMISECNKTRSQLQWTRHIVSEQAVIKPVYPMESILLAVTSAWV
jgi:predicted permease